MSKYKTSERQRNIKKKLALENRKDDSNQEQSLVEFMKSKIRQNENENHSQLHQASHSSDS